MDNGFQSYVKQPDGTFRLHPDKVSWLQDS